MFAVLGMLLLTVTPVVPPAGPQVGPGKNGVAVAALPSSSPWAAAALTLRRPATVTDGQARAAVAIMAAAATAALGREAGPDRPGAGVEVEVTGDRIAVVVVVPAASADLAMRALDAALKSLRAAPPKTPAPLPIVVGGRAPLPPGDVDVAAALNAVDSTNAAVAVIGPGPGPELLRRASAAVAAPLTKTTTTTTTTTKTTTTPAAFQLADPTPTLAAAVEVLALLVGGTVRRVGNGVVLEVPGVADGGRAMLEGVAGAPPPPEVVVDAAARRRLALALPLGDVGALALRLADDLAIDPGRDAADASLGLIDAVVAVTPADVSRAAAALIAGDAR
jgi:hypothetical protein